jgi:mevalonate kinase
MSFTRSHHEISFDPVPLPDGQRGIPLHLILVNTHVPRQTKKLVAAVRSLHDLFPNIFTPVLEAMGQISATFCTAMQREQSDSTGVFKVPLDAVLTLVRTNQSLLASLGVSHPSLDRICDTINNNSEFRSLAAAKLTGAGGGGCAMILLWPDNTSVDTNATLERLRSKIITTLQAVAQADYQFTFLSSTVGGDGVLFTSPSDFETVQCS